MEGYGATASTLENVTPEAAGGMSFRPGLKFLVQAPETEEVAQSFFMSFDEGPQEGDAGTTSPWTIDNQAGVNATPIFLFIKTPGNVALNVPDGFTELAVSHEAAADQPRLHIYFYNDNNIQVILDPIVVTTANGNEGLLNYFMLTNVSVLDPDVPLEVSGEAFGSSGDPETPRMDPSWTESGRGTTYISVQVDQTVGSEDPPESYTVSSGQPFGGPLYGPRVAYRNSRNLFDDPGSWGGAQVGTNHWAGFTIAWPAFQLPQEEDPTKTTILEEFVYKIDQKYLLLMTQHELRIIEDGGVIVELESGAAVSNGTFSTLSGWTNFCAGNSTAEGDATLGLILFCDGPNDCGVRQSIVTPAPDTRHHLNIEVTRGPVTLRIGNFSASADSQITMTLRTGSHRVGFTPTGTFDLEFSSSVRREVFVSSVEISSGEDLVLTTPWDGPTLRSLRFTQDLNVMYVTDGINTKRRIERHDADSWSLTVSDEQDGPFDATNSDETILLQPSTRTGNGNLFANKDLFHVDDIGQLVRITQNGQFEERTVNGADQWSDPVRVTGVGTSRDITWTVAGVFTATVIIQRSVGNDVAWEVVSGGTGTTTTTVPGVFAFNDGQDNSTIYYRVGTPAAGFTSGSADVSIFFAGGSTDGVARITDYFSSLIVAIEILQSFAALTASSEWALGSWSDVSGWPRATAIWDGRLWNGRDGDYWGSVSEVYESHSAGDDASDAIARTVGIGAQAPSIVWMLGLNRMLLGTSGSVADVQPVMVQTGLLSVQASSLDEAVTNTTLTLRTVDASAIYVDQSEANAVEVLWDGSIGNYKPRSLMRLHRDLGRDGILQIAVAYRPDPRIFLIRADGQCLVKLYDTGENALGWCRLVTDGTFQSVAVLPGNNEDEVYFVVKRNINGELVQYVEKLDPFFLDDIADARRLDSYVEYKNQPFLDPEQGGFDTIIPVDQIAVGTGDSLIGELVQVFADGVYIGTRIITEDGQFDEVLSKEYSTISFGKSYEGLYQSSKLALGAQAGSAIGQKGRPASVAFVLLGSTRAIEFGGDFDSMDLLPDRVAPVDAGSGATLEDVTTDFYAIPGAHTNDPRICLRFQSPFPVTITGFVLGFHLDEKVKA